MFVRTPPGDRTGAGYTSGTNYGTTGTGYSGPSDTVGTGTDYNTIGERPTGGERIKSKVPGTDEYEATHGYDRNQERAEQVKSYVPGG